MNRSRAETVHLADVEATRAAARGVAAELAPGDVVALVGPLGAGKTEFVKAAAAELGVEEDVTSPTFVRLQIYKGQCPVYHLDFYRVTDAAECRALGLDEWLDSGGIALVEWADRAPEVFPASSLTVELAYSEDAGSRVLTRYAGPPRSGRKD